MKTWVLYLLSILLLISIVGFSIGRGTAKEVIIENFQEGETQIFIAQVDTFSQDKLISMLADLNVDYPHIVMAQSILETGHFKSDIFFENHNQCRYLSKLDSEEDYFEYLGASYAEATNYVKMLKQVIKKNDLEKLF